MTNTADLKTADGTYLIVERRRVPREPVVAKAESFDFASSPQMMGIGGLIILGVLFASYTTKYDASIGHVGGAIPVPAIGFLALELFLTRAAFRLFHDIHTFDGLGAYMRTRILRYLPATVPAVLLGYLVIKTSGYPGAHASASALPINLLMLADMFGVDEIDSSHWRLKIEIIQSSLVAILWFGPMRRHLAPLLTIGLAVNAFYMTGELMRHNVLTLHGFLTCDGYLPLFVFGAALHQIMKDKRSPLWWTMLAVSGLLAALSNEPAHWIATSAGLVVTALVATGHLSVLGRFKALNTLGRIAFPIYIVHFVTGFAIIHSLEQHGCPTWVAILAASAGAIALGSCLNVVFERPAEKHGPALFRSIGRMARQGAGITAPWIFTPAFDAISIDGTKIST